MLLVFLFYFRLYKQVQRRKKQIKVTTHSRQIVTRKRFCWWEVDASVSSSLLFIFFNLFLLSVHHLVLCLSSFIILVLHFVIQPFLNTFVNHSLYKFAHPSPTISLLYLSRFFEELKYKCFYEISLTQLVC